MQTDGLDSPSHGFEKPKGERSPFGFSQGLSARGIPIGGELYLTEIKKLDSVLNFQTNPRKRVSELPAQISPTKHVREPYPLWGSEELRPKFLFFF
jgi:hypothetical protein